MPYYHVRIRKTKPSHWVFAFDLTKEKLENDFLSHFKKQESFMCGTNLIRFADIDSFGINKTELSSNEILKKTRIKRIFNKLGVSSTDTDRYLIDAEEIVYSGKDVTNEFLGGLDIPERNLPKIDLSVGKKTVSQDKDKFFIVHGRDDRQALLLQKYLKDKLKLKAIMFDDLPDKGRTIIEQIEFIRNNVSYAFVIVTPDDVGCLRFDVEKIEMTMEGLKTVPAEMVGKLFGALSNRARQNVVFELGLFIGALGREHVCCLKQKNVTEKPSDIDGVLYKEFNTEVKEIFHELADEIT